MIELIKKRKWAIALCITIFIGVANIFIFIDAGHYWALALSAWAVANAIYMIIRGDLDAN